MRFKLIITLFAICLFSSIQAYNKDSLIAVIRSEEHDSLKIKACFTMIWELKKQSPDTGLYYAKKALELAIRSKNKKARAGSLKRMGILNRQKGELAEAVMNLTQAIELYKELKEIKGLSDSYNNLGNVYINIGSMDKALEYHSKSLKYRRELGDSADITASFMNIGEIYRKIQDFPKSEFNTMKALSISRAIHDSESIAKCLGNLSLLFTNTKNYDKAIQYNKECVSLTEIIGNIPTRINALNTLANIYNDTQEFEKTLQTSLEVLELRTKINDLYGIIQSKGNVGKTYYNLRDQENSEKYLLEAYKGAVLLGTSELQEDYAYWLYMIYKKRKELDKALPFLERSRKLNDSLHNFNTQDAMTKSKILNALDNQEAELKLNAKMEREKLESINRSEQLKKNIIMYSVSIVLIIILLFSYFLFKRYKLTISQKEIIEIQKNEVEHQKEIVEEKQKEILDSIHYANRIQKALLANADLLKKHLHDYTIFFKPKDIVSGDFYWATEHKGKFYFAVCDSTGHGVPGGFMCLLNIGFLSEAVNEKEIESPGEILNYVRNRLINSISKEGQKDGFDGIILCKELASGKITYSAANNAPVIISASGVTELPYDKMPVGVGERTDSFITYTIPDTKNSNLFLYTDGFADQFGGPNGKKFKYKQLEELLISIHDLPMNEQSIQLGQKFNEWKRELEQVDDVCVIGIKL